MNEEIFMTLAHVIVESEIKKFEVRCEEIFFEALGNVLEEGETYRNKEFALIAVENEARHIIHSDRNLNCFLEDIFYQQLENFRRKWESELKPIIRVK